MSIDEFSHLSKNELRQAVSRLADTANKRLKRMANTELVSPAQIEAIDSGGKFSTRGKSEIELQIEFRRVSNFLSDKTSTSKGAKEYMEETRNAIKDVFGIDINKSVLSLYFYIPSGFRTSRGLIFVLVRYAFQSSGVPERDFLKSVFETAS